MAPKRLTGALTRARKLNAAPELYATTYHGSEKGPSAKTPAGPGQRTDAKMLTSRVQVPRDQSVGDNSTKGHITDGGGRSTGAVKPSASLQGAGSGEARLPAASPQRNGRDSMTPTGGGPARGQTTKAGGKVNAGSKAQPGNIPAQGHPGMRTLRPTASPQGREPGNRPVASKPGEKGNVPKASS